MRFNLMHSRSDERRVAYIVGNNSYAMRSLRCCKDDAERMCSILEDIGFEIFTAIDADAETMKDLFHDFYEALEGSDIGIFYFSGHGLQLKGENYLLATDTISPSGVEISKSLNIASYLNKMMQRSRVSLVILDACRDNPFGGLPGGPGDSNAGLVQIALPRLATSAAAQDQAQGEVLIAFATAPNQVALEGEHLSRFTEQLALQLEIPGWELTALLKRVTGAVRRATNNEQVPWQNSNLSENTNLVLHPRSYGSLIGFVAVGVVALGISVLLQNVPIVGELAVANAPVIDGLLFAIALGLAMLAWSGQRATSALAAAVFGFAAWLVAVYLYDTLGSKYDIDYQIADYSNAIQECTFLDCDNQAKLESQLLALQERLNKDGRSTDVYVPLMVSAMSGWLITFFGCAVATRQMRDVALLFSSLLFLSILAVAGRFASLTLNSFTPFVFFDLWVWQMFLLLVVGLRISRAIRTEPAVPNTIFVRPDGYKTILIWSLIGLASGLLCVALGFPIIAGDIKRLLYFPELETFSIEGENGQVYLAQGMVFGTVVGALIWWTSGKDFVWAIAAWMGTIIVWYGAVWLTLVLMWRSENPDLQILGVLLLCGTAGAMGVLAISSLLSARLAKIHVWVVMLFVSLLASFPYPTALLLGQGRADHALNLLMLYPVWQACVAGCLAYGLSAVAPSPVGRCCIARHAKARKPASQLRV